jgi:glucose-6-phosphate 1-dehydrogenase
MNDRAGVPHCSAVVLFGATGDLARRMLWPSLYALHCDGILPEGMRVIGTAQSAWSREAFLARVREAIAASANAPVLEDSLFASFSERVHYCAADAAAAGGLAGVRDLLRGAAPGPVIFYLSTSPHLFEPICRALREQGLADGDSRVIVEKPLGSDLASARRINEAIASAFQEDRIYRIDHYLGKEPVQNLIALRFGNAIFEPLWNATAIEQVQITVAETVGVEGRWGYYDRAGALRDMVQSHLLQLLCLVAMEPPASFTPSAVRNEKVKVLWSLAPIGAAEVGTHTVIGQYEGGFADGRAVPGYREEEGANAASETETFVALRVGVENWRWAGVPFYLRTGKRMQRRQSEIVIQFRQVPHNIFGHVGPGLAPNVLHIALQPEENITLTLMHKEPGLQGMQLGQVGLNLSLSSAFAGERRRIAYERMFFDVMRGNSALFVRRDEVEVAWEWVDRLVEGWKATGMKPRPYMAGSWGPTAAIALAERSGHSWAE